MRRTKNDTGITLIALIITVIILIILSAITIDIVMDKDFFGKAQDVVGKADSKLEEDKQQEEEIKNVWDQPPGKIIKSKTAEKTTIEIMATTSNITRTSFRVHATGTNKDGDILTYVLKVGDTTYEEKTGTEVYWDVTGLEPNSKYQYEVIAKDSSTENSVIGSETTLANSTPTVNVSVTNIAATTATITATGADSEGDELQYTLEINGKTYGPSTTNTWNITGLAETTTHSYTVKVADIYDTITKTGSFTTSTSNVAPVIATNSLSSRTTSSITIAVKATDSNGDNLVYKLYTSTSSSGTYTLKATSAATAQNTQVTLTASSLSNYTTYYWYITVTDTDNATTTSGKQNTRTYCPGTGYTCYTSSCTGVGTITCTTCNGNKTISGSTCTEVGDTCWNCGGDGGWGGCDCDDSGSDWSQCDDCGGYNDWWWCDPCGAWGNTGCPCSDGVADYDYPCTCGDDNPWEDCSTCNGDGIADTCSHGNTSSHATTITCTKCSGTGKIAGGSCSHGYTSSHRYCTHYTTTTLTSHAYCSHGYTYQH